MSISRINSLRIASFRETPSFHMKWRIIRPPVEPAKHATGQRPDAAAMVMHSQISVQLLQTFLFDLLIPHECVVPHHDTTYLDYFIYCEFINVIHIYLDYADLSRTSLLGAMIFYTTKS
jgi:hypothetical protein